MYTTLNKIRDKSPCVDGWAKLLKYLGKTQADDAPLSIKTVLESNGLEDALWCLRTVEGRGKEIRLLAVKYARAVQHLMPPESVRLLDVAEAYANGEATGEELDKARAASAAAAWAAQGAAGDATRAAWAADAAAAAAADAADAAWDAAGDAAGDAAASMAAAAAARAAAWAASAAAARAAARAAAWDAASAALETQQAKDLLDLCNQLEKT